MKISKKMVLLSFLVARHSRIQSQEWFSYQELYERIPLEESTIRGIVAQFLRADMLQRRDDETGVRFRCSAYGWETVYDVFPFLSQTKPVVGTTIVSFDRALHRSDAEIAEELRILHAVPIDTHTFLVPETLGQPNLRRLQKRTLHCLPLGATTPSAASVFLFWKRTRHGQACVLEREQCQKIIRMLRLNQRGRSPTGKRSREVLYRAYAGFISATCVSWDIPDVYYPQELRLNEFIRSM